MKKIIFLVIIVLLITSCGNLKDFYTTDRTTTPTITGDQDITRQIPERPNFRQGTSGLKLNFVQNKPENEIKFGDSFIIALKIHNQGATDIINGKISIEGLLDQHDAVNMVKSEYVDIYEFQPFDVKGKSMIYFDGQNIELKVKAKAKSIDPKKEKTPVSFELIAKYPYETIAAIPICINLDSIEDNTHECKRNTIYTLSGGQGAPVAVTQIEQDLIDKGEISEKQNKINLRYTITVEDKGNIGERIDGDINIKVFLSKDKEITQHCEPLKVKERIILDKEGKPQKAETKVKKWVCELEDVYNDKDIQKTEYTSLIRVELKYNYVTTTTKSLYIIKSKDSTDTT